MFSGSRIKIKRAKKHIVDLRHLITTFIRSDFYSVSIEKDRTGTNFLKFDFKVRFPSEAASTILGDALHNLRGALDLLYYQIVLQGEGTLSRWTHFPIFETREELEAFLNEALKKKQITAAIHGLILATIMPYRAEASRAAGNYPLWALHKLNIMDKHRLLIPARPHIGFAGLRLEDDQRTVLDEGVSYIIDDSGRVRLDAQGSVAIKNKAQARGTILFDGGLPHEWQPLIPALNGIAEEVTGTVKAFEVAVGATE